MRNTYRYKILIFALATALTMFRVTHVIAADTTLTPSPIVSTDPEISAPLRGLYDWRGTILVAPPTPSLDAYERYYWNELETSSGVYNWSVIDADIAAARAKNKFFAFRIRTLKGPNDAGSFVPSDLTNTSYGWYKGSTFILDLNNLTVQARMQTFFKALEAHLIQTGMAKYISWMDIGMVGQYGEWGLDSISYTTANYPSEASLKRVIDIQLGILPDTRKVMMAKTNSTAVLYALNSSPLVGWRVDCLGQDGYFDFSTNKKYTPFWPVMQNRWKTAPVIVEYCAGTISFSTASTQISDYHISAVGNGNVSIGGSNTSALFVNNGKKAGYRLALIDVSLPNPLVANTTNNLVSRWQNTGNAPTYEPWAITYQLENAAGTVVASSTSTLDLKSLLPTTIPQSASDPINLTGIVPGTYTLSVIVKDPRGLRQPLPLAIAGRRTSGSYPLGSVTVSSSSTSVPSPIIKIGDATGDSIVDVADFAIWKNSFLTKPISTGNTFGDFDNNSKVDGIDYMLWVNNYGK